jgi:hypothetical protein
VYQAAFAVANNPATNSRAAVAAKNRARNEADRVSRTYAQIIKNAPGVPNELKAIVGAPVPNVTRGRRRKGPPATFPYLYVARDGVLGLGSMVKLSFRDAALGTGRMPREVGITHLVVHAQVTPALPVEADAPMAFMPAIAPMQVIAHITRNPFPVRFDASLLGRFGLSATSNNDPGREFQAVKVMFCGQWLNAKGDVGPLGLPAMLQIPVSGKKSMRADRDNAGDQPQLKLAA